MSCSKNKNVSETKLPSTSTPKNTFPIRRGPIHNKRSLSPIPRVADKSWSSKEQTEESLDESESESDHIEEVEISSGLSGFRLHSESVNTSDISNKSSQGQIRYIREKSSQEIKRITPNNSKSFSNTSPNDAIFKIFQIGCLIILMLGIAFAVVNVNLQQTNITIPNLVTIEELKDQYPLQLEDTWNALETGINEVINFNKPSVFLLLYEAKAEETVNRILKSIGKYAVCSLKQNCETQPILLQSSDLKTLESVTDYGYVIKKYKPELEKKAIMIVKNLDQVPGEVAQAFHSMCDEYTPLVDKTAFFFTMKVDDLSESQTDLQLVENVLRDNWDDLNDDIFYPLLTRITNMVVKIIPEKL